SVIVMFVFLLNTVNVVIGNIDTEENELGEDFEIQTEYTVTNTSEENKPNIYWFHCDGMLGFSSMEQYFGDDQQEFAEALEQRGFIINKDAYFEAAHRTKVALPSLMCPYAYDSYLAERLSTHELAMWNLEFSQSFRDSCAQFRYNLELFNTFESNAYTSILINGVFPYFYYTADELYVGSKALETERFLVKEDVKSWTLEEFNKAFAQPRPLATEEFLFSISSPLGTLFEYIRFEVMDTSPVALYDNIVESADLFYPSDDLISELLEGQDDVAPGDQNAGCVIPGLCNSLMSGDSPRISIIAFNMNHFPFILDEYGNIVVEDAKRSDFDSTAIDYRIVQNYAPQHRYAAKVLVNLIDFILEEDPNAVIVLQGDHGLHENTIEDFKEAFGEDFGEEDTLNMWNNVMSAVRVPEQYQNGDEEHLLTTPLNITRYLVNNFVGENYEYLD
ncbi:MAG: hypothetical protein Q4B42_05680, partial [Oscillospiraceae bacterium]|nr:hypothetical protein [Oscillospiraceae bacterium]